jgi:hypothetical protein
MADKIKLILKFGEQRRTLYLNAHNKDDYGRHRGQVLYGMDLSGSGTVITVAPGAVYTAQGNRLFFDVPDGTIDLGPSGIDAFDVALRPQYPVCVMVYLRYQFDTAQVAKPVEGTTAVGLTAATLSARIVPFDRHTASPAYNLLPRDPVTLDDLQPSGYPSIQTWNEPSTTAITSADKQADSIQFGEIPLGYVLIGTNPVSNAYPTNLNSSGVEIVSYGNAFDMVSDLLGVDALVPRHDGRVVAGLVQAVNGTALRQGESANVCGSNTSPPLASPHYGTPEVGVSGTRADSEFETYRQPNFMRDGDSILDALRRVDVVLRQHINRVGSQDLVALFQDGVNGSIPARATLDEILAYASGSPTNLATNLNSVTYNNGAVGSDPDNHVLKGGLIPHVENGLTTKLGTNEGDSLKSAVEALDVGMFIVLSNILGVDIPRSELRNVASTAAPAWDDIPEGRPDLTVGAFSGAATSPLLTDETFDQALRTLLQRSFASPGTNWLANSGFWAGALSGTQAALPPYWAVTGGTATWTVTDKFNGKDGAQLGITADANAELVQTLVGASANNFLGELLSSASHFSFSALIGNTGANPIVVEVTGYSDTAGTTPVFSFATASIAAGAPQRLVTATTKVNAATTVNRVTFRIRAATPGQTWGATLGGASVNTGLPVNFHASTAATEFLSRDGGTRAAMRGALYHGGFQAKDAADATDPQDLVPLAQVEDLIADAISGAGVASGSHAITAAGAFSWEIPVGVTRVRVTLVGGGGAGGSGGRGVTGEGDDNGGGGGGGGGTGGGTVSFELDTTPGEDITGTLGAGGVPGGINSGVANDGSPSTLTYDGHTATAPGGQKGLPGQSNISTGGLGGAGAVSPYLAGPGGAGGKGGPGATNAVAGTAGLGGLATPGAAGATGGGDSTERAGGGGGGGTPSMMGALINDTTPIPVGGTGGNGGDGDGGGSPGVAGGAGTFGAGGGGGGGGPADNGGGGDETGKPGGAGGAGWVMFSWGV